MKYTLWWCLFTSVFFPFPRGFVQSERQDVSIQFPSLIHMETVSIYLLLMCDAWLGIKDPMRGINGLKGLETEDLEVKSEISA